MKIIRHPLFASLATMHFAWSVIAGSGATRLLGFLNWPRVTVNAGPTVRVPVIPDGSLQIFKN